MEAFDAAVFCASIAASRRNVGNAAPPAMPLMPPHQQRRLSAEGEGEAAPGGLGGTQQQTFGHSVAAWPGGPASHDATAPFMGHDATGAPSSDYLGPNHQAAPSSNMPVGAVDRARDDRARARRHAAAAAARAARSAAKSSSRRIQPSPAISSQLRQQPSTSRDDLPPSAGHRIPSLDEDHDERVERMNGRNPLGDLRAKGCRKEAAPH